MHTLLIVLVCSGLGLGPVLSEAGTAGEQPPAQQQLISRENVKLIQECLTAEGVYAGPLDGEVSAQTAAALRQYQQKHGLPVSGEADEATLKQLQIRLPASRQGEGR